MIDYAQLDPGVRDLVRLLNAYGWRTIDSGDGVTKPEVGRTLPGPHVVMRLPRGQESSLVSKANRLRPLLPPGWWVEASYSTKDRVCLLFAFGPEAAK